MGSLTYSRTLEVIECGECHIPFAIPANMHDSVIESGAYFYCPNGHNVHYSETKNQRLARELAETTRMLERARAQRDAQADQRLAAERSNIALRGHLTRLRNRIAAGVCPWCRRSFRDVMSHVDSKHPEHSHKARQAIVESSVGKQAERALPAAAGRDAATSATPAAADRDRSSTRPSKGEALHAPAGEPVRSDSTPGETS